MKTINNNNNNNLVFPFSNSNLADSADYFSMTPVDLFVTNLKI